MGDLTINLSRSEFACKCGCGFDTVDFDLPTVIQKCVHFFQDENSGMRIGVRINSGSRCRSHNKFIGGSKKSLHLIGRAADIALYDKLSGNAIPADQVAEYFIRAYPVSYGVGRYKGRTHIDVRSGSKARWDQR